jgi:NTE family protein
MGRPTRVALALGSGGARGYAHIGVIQVLEERGYEIVGVAGSSMGAVVGGLHAAGRLDAYTEWVRTLTQRDVLRLFDPVLRGPGAIRGEKILAKVTDLLEGAVIEELPVPFTAVATDLLTGKEVWFQHGPVDTAIRASIALPSFFTPVMLNGRLLADGGLLNPVPVAATAASGADLVVAVSLSGGETASPGPDPVRESAEPGPVDEWFDRSRRALSDMLDSDLVRTVVGWLTTGRDSSSTGAGPTAVGQEEDRRGVFEELPAGLGTLDVMQRSLEVVQGAIMRYRLAGYPPDVLITVPKHACRTLDFHRAEELIALGREQAADALDRAGISPQT